jgi:hypothetical protein
MRLVTDLNADRIDGNAGGTEKDNSREVVLMRRNLAG